jgi:hypothetical protein
VHITEPTSRSFRPEDVPPSGSATIRLPLGVHPNGSTGEPGTVLANIAWNEMLERQKEAPLPHPPETVEIELKKVVRTKDGYKLADRPSVKAVPQRLNTRPGKFTSLDVEGADILASFLLGQEAYELAPDRLVWQSLLEAVEQTEATGHALRKLCDAVALAVCTRAGAVLEAQHLRWE